jgi:tetratricopeptide (TPR) repeat protein
MKVGAMGTEHGGEGVSGPAAKLLLGDELRAVGRFDEARAAYLEAIGALTTGLAEAHARLGLAYLQEGRIDEARGPLERAAALEPGRVDYWDHLGGIYEWAEEYAAAIECWRRVLALAPDHRARPHIGLGWALQQLGRLEEAKAEFHAAAAIEPGAAEPRLSLGLLEMERGEFAEAEAAFRAALRLSPTCDMALYWLASMHGAAMSEEDLDALKTRLDDPGTGAEPRTRLLFALGHVLDARGEYPRAARCFREANALQLSRLKLSRGVDLAGRAALVDGLIRVFDRDFFARLAGAGLDTREPVFVVGLPRSGTTLVEQVLASHPAVHGAGELLLGPRTLDALPAAVGRPVSPIDCVPLLEAAHVRRLAEGYLEQLRGIAGDRAERVVDKLPENFMLLGLLTTLFPGATVIHCRRDLRDVALSCWTADFRSVPWASDAAHIGAIFREYQRIMDHWRATLTAPIHEVDYEEIVSDFQGAARRLISAIDLDWHPACGEFHRTPRPVHTGSRVQVRQPIHTRSVARWKHYEQELADLFASLPTSPGQLPHRSGLGHPRGPARSWPGKA